MDLIKLMDTAVEKNEIIRLLCGEKPYEIDVTEFTNDVFPTEVNYVLVNCIYNRINDVPNLESIFINCLKEMIQKDAMSLYIALLYFDACIFQEENGNATFCINKKELSEIIRTSVDYYKNTLSNQIQFPNGLIKHNPLKNIENFNKYYEKRYSFSIV